MIDAVGELPGDFDGVSGRPESRHCVADVRDLADPQGGVDLDGLADGVERGHRSFPCATSAAHLR